MSYRIAVRALCDFTARQGDLDLRFTPAPSPQEGMAGHAWVAARREPGYEKEISLSASYGRLQVSGRADGYDPMRQRLEEIKTHRGDLARQPTHHRHLHWAQAKLYGYLLATARGLDELEVALVYFDIDRQTETVILERHGLAELRAFFVEQCERFIAWADQEARHREARNRMLEQLRFPMTVFRAGQRELAEAVYRCARRGICLMAQAPTGIGKTLGTLFPQLKAFPGGTLDKLYFLTAKTSGRRAALDALGSLDQGGAPILRVLELVARDKVCEHPDKACHGASCPLARGFYDRLAAARVEALRQPMLTREAVRDAALAHDVCPYYLSQDLARWADVIVGDYNYYFDQGGMLYGLMLADDLQVGVLADEAHNLLERARAMHSAELDQRHYRQRCAGAPAELKSPLDRVQRAWSRFNREQAAPYAVYDALPHALWQALQQLLAAMTAYLSEQPDGLDAELQSLYFDVLRFCRAAEHFSDHSFLDCERVALSGHVARPRFSSRISLRNVVPATFLEPRFRQAQSVVLFSATLHPWSFHADLLGLPASAAWLDVESPFEAGQLTVKVARHISTRYADRAASLSRIVELMARQYQERPGNYLAFFSSFEYLQQAADAFARQCPEIPVWSQKKGQSEAERQAFLERFVPDGAGIGFAVLGGAFGEGVDLPGSRLIGVFVATLGLPQVNPVNEEIRRRLEHRFGAGYDYAYLYPGVQKVVQAAGRLIRSSQDTGVLHLMDDRYARAAVRTLLPVWWRLDT